MSLIICPECGKEFSDRAKRCPNCACPIEYVLSVLNADKNNFKMRIVKKDVPIKVKPYKTIVSDDNCSSFNTYQEYKSKSSTSTIINAKKYLQTVDIKKVVNDAKYFIEEANKRIEERDLESKEKFFKTNPENTHLFINMHYDTLSDKFDVYDEVWKVKYTVKGNLMPPKHRLYVYDKHGNEVASIKESIFENPFKLQAKSASITIHNNDLGTIDLFTSLKRIKHRVNFNGWQILGSAMGRKHTIIDNDGNEVGHIDYKFLLHSGAYVIDFVNSNDELLVLTIALAVKIGNSESRSEELKHSIRRKSQGIF